MACVSPPPRPQRQNVTEAGSAIENADPGSAGKLKRPPVLPAGSVGELKRGTVVSDRQTHARK